jgi:hypothetical protein
MHTRFVSVLVAGVLGALATTASADGSKTESTKQDIDWGFGAKVRRSHASKRFQKLFVGDTPGPATQDGVGVEFTRRIERVEIVLGLGFDRLDGRDGYYLEKGEDPLEPGTVDYLDFDRLSWFTIEVTAVGHLQLHKILGLRYGAGLGVGIVRGEARKTDALCTSDNLQQDCVLDPLGTDVDKHVDLWPVLPVVNLLAGVEFRPMRALAIYVDAGLHTVPYVSAGATLYLW